MLINPITITLSAHHWQALQIAAEKRLTALSEGSLQYRQLEAALDHLIDARLAAAKKLEA